MAEAKKAYVCRECGYDAPKWLGKCPSCGAWNTFDELVVAKKGSSVAAAVTSSAVPKAKPQRVQDIQTGTTKRIDVGQSEVNRVLGGGLVPGSIILVGGEPGIGKSTLALQLALAENGLRTLYVSGEESAEQIKMRAERLGIHNEECVYRRDYIWQSVTRNSGNYSLIRKSRRRISAPWQVSVRQPLPRWEKMGMSQQKFC